MRIESAKEKERKKKKEKQQKDWIETYIFSVMQKSIEAAAKAALDDLFKDWK